MHSVAADRPLLLETAPPRRKRPAAGQGWLYLGFFLGLLILALPDFTSYRDMFHRVSPRVVDLDILGSITGALLFSVIFFLLRADIGKRRRAEAAASEANHQLWRLNEALRASNSIKTEFLHLAAHDLKNPINAIMNLSRLIPADIERHDAVLETAGLIERSSHEMLGLIERVLESAAAETGKVSLQTRPVDLTALVEDAVLQNRPLAGRKQQLVLFSTGRPCAAEVDELMIRQVLDNLINNAIKFSAPGTTIAVSVCRAGPAARIEVKDRGPGMTEEDLRRVFGKFQRLSARPTGGESSTGLGLSIVRYLVDLHGGFVFAESEGSGKGSRFIVELPLSHDSAADSSRTPAPAPPAKDPAVGAAPFK